MRNILDKLELSKRAQPVSLRTQEPAATEKELVLVAGA